MPQTECGFGKGAVLGGLGHVCLHVIAHSGLVLVPEPCPSPVRPSNNVTLLSDNIGINPVGY